MIVGLGVEWVDVPRFDAVRRRFGRRLEERLFTPDERRYAASRPRSESLAVRFAAKLAARRALGARGLSWHEIEVVRDPDGPPGLRFHGAAAASAGALGVARSSLSLTHDAACCISQVVLEGRA
ncbi:MAG: holo-ACP synthase [Proteobacteria bacterium]|nr:holo-ACP synthase [Pseudomonadota bacterium]